MFSITKPLALCLFCLFFPCFVFGQMEDEEMCLPFRRSVLQNQGVGRGVQGPPGKLGPAGHPGLKGSKGEEGEPGQCGCDPSEIERLEEQIRQLRETVKLMRGLISFLPSLNINYFITHCSVGLKDGRVRDGDIVASSEVNNHDAHYGRLDYKRPDGVAWHCDCWASLIRRRGEWIQVDLKSSTSVTGVVTQGRGDGDQWVTSFKISYGNSTSELHVIQDEDENDVISPGNTDRNTHVMNRFPHPVVARYVRLIVWEFHGHPSMRLEYVTC